LFVFILEIILDLAAILGIAIFGLIKLKSEKQIKSELRVYLV